LNQFILSATLIAKEAIRYTPAGVPIIECQLEHAGSVEEAGLAREVRMRIEAMAMGSVHQDLDRLALGQSAQWTGFLAHKSLRSQRLVFHITNIAA